MHYLTSAISTSPEVNIRMLRCLESAAGGNTHAWPKLIRRRSGVVKPRDDQRGIFLQDPFHAPFRGRCLVAVSEGAAFLEMMKLPAYQVANIERENGCADHAIIAVRETYNRWTKG